MNVLLGSSALLLWPRFRCAALMDRDVVLVDSPGLDADAGFDESIEELCADADLFVWVLDGESTANLVEKNFFVRVTQKISKPNILVLVNRCVSFKPRIVHCSLRSVKMVFIVVW